MLKQHGDWIELGSADEQKQAKDGTVEAWGRASDNPVGGWYGTKKGYRGRFGMYVPPLLEELGMAELEHNPRNNRMRAIEPREIADRITTMLRGRIGRLHRDRPLRVRGCRRDGGIHPGRGYERRPHAVGVRRGLERARRDGVARADRR